MRLPSPDLLRAVAFVAAAALFWLQYFDLKDAARPEPRLRLLASFALGIGAAILAVLGFVALTALGFPPVTAGPAAGVAWYCFAIGAPVEEGAKFLVARVACFRWRTFDERVDGLVYATAVALGFATLENLLYVPALSWGEGLVRALASPLTHSLFAAVWGFGAAHALVPRQRFVRRVAWQAGTLSLAMLLHGTYDFAILAYGATYAAAAIVLVVWVFVIWYARRAAKHDSDHHSRSRSSLHATSIAESSASTPSRVTPGGGGESSAVRS